MWDDAREGGDAPEEKLLRHAKFILSNLEATKDPEMRLKVWGFDEESQIYMR